MNGEPLRIVQVVETLDVGGLERLAVDLASAQKQAGHLPAIFCVFHPGALAAQAEAAGVPVIAFHKKKGFTWSNIRAMAAELRRLRADVVHTHNSVIHHYGLLAAWRAGVRVTVNTRHGLGVLHSARRQDYYFRATMPWTDRVVTVSEDGREFFVRHRGVPQDICQVIYNGVPLARFLAQPATPGAFRPRLRFGTVGRMVPAKAHDVLIRAFAQVLQHYPQAELHIAGDGTLAAANAALVEQLQLRQSVHLPGITSDPPSFLKDLDVFVLSSISEGMPIVVQEAMAASLPIVSTRIGGVPEMAPEGSVAFYAEPGDAGSLAAAMRQAAASPDLSAMGEAARRIACERFGIEKTQLEYEALFRRLLAR
ncbi:MAG TPA: glycosyltransferase [Armatimonadota bacterium]|jgi:glycosyltransferase involved in cell wall biosynthesis